MIFCVACHLRFERVHDDHFGLGSTHMNAHHPFDLVEFTLHSSILKYHFFFLFFPNRNAAGSGLPIGLIGVRFHFRNKGEFYGYLFYVGRLSVLS